jgi:hypothetical protein
LISVVVVPVIVTVVVIVSVVVVTVVIEEPDAVIRATGIGKPVDASVTDPWRIQTGGA